jgi:hypothetical protein
MLTANKSLKFLDLQDTKENDRKEPHLRLKDEDLNLISEENLVFGYNEDDLKILNLREENLNHYDQGRLSNNESDNHLPNSYS